MSGVTNVRLTSEAGITDIEFIGGGVVRISQRKTPKSKAVVTDLTPFAKFAKGKGTLVGTIVTAIGTGKDLSEVGDCVF